jgi:hypothetical protein
MRADLLRNGEKQMYIEDLDEVATLRNHLRKYEGLRMAAGSGSVGDLVIAYNGERFDSWSCISADVVRAAIITECDRLLEVTKQRLGELGVNTAPKLSRAA